MDTRPSWDEYFLKIAQLTSERSNCIKRKVGSIIVKNNRILSLGYNGVPSGMKNCFEGGCKRCFSQWESNKSNKGKDLDLCICLHAEENAMLFLSQNEMENSTIYVTLFPCISCFKKIIQCKIKRVVYIEEYNVEMKNIVLELLNDLKEKILIEKINIF